MWQYILKDGTLTYGEPFYWLHNDDNSHPLDIQAITFDGNGNLWAATNLGLQICDQNGRVRGIVRLPHDIEPIIDIAITEGYVWLHTASTNWIRHFNVSGPILGVRPESQGQG